MGFQIVDLFSGIGGFSLAGHWMGWRTIQFCEINSDCHPVLQYHYPGVPIHSDIKTLTADVIKQSPGYRPMDTTIVVGGFPCQPYSTAGKRLGKDDSRHLWPEMLRVIREVRPEWVVGENVRGLLSWNDGLVFNEVHTDLENEGYEVWAFVLPACGVNAPHRRDRVWFVAKNTHEDGRGGNQRESQSGIRRFWNAGTGDNEWFHQQPDAWAASDAEGLRINRAQEYENGDRQGGERWRRNIDDIGEVSEWEAAPHPGGIESQGRMHTDGTGATERYISPRSAWIDTSGTWDNFPTQSPVCVRNDGISSELSGITISKWRKNSIMQLGNSVVPQVVYQIFKSIQYTHDALHQL